MAATLNLVPASHEDFDAILRLLSENELPVADLGAHLDAFLLAKVEGTIVGSVGVEVYGEFALLRSLCVAKPHRAQRIAVALVAAAEAQVAAQGVRELYLLTTSAAAYFAMLGFSSLAREQAPPEIRNTAQFSSLCPSAAVCMQKAIGPSIAHEAG